MTAPYFNPRLSCPECQKLGETLMPGNGSSLSNIPQRRCLAFGLDIKKNTPELNLNRSIQDQITHNLFNAPFYKTAPARAICSHKTSQCELFYLSPITPKTYLTVDRSVEKGNDSQLGIKIGHVLSTAAENSFQPGSINNNHQASTEMMQETTGNIFLNAASAFSLTSNSEKIPNQLKSTVYPLEFEQVGNVADESCLKLSEPIADKRTYRLARMRNYHRECRKDPAYVKRVNQRRRERRRELRKDPAYVERVNQRQRERQRELRKDPAYVERENQRQKERQRKLRKDPAYVERVNQRQRERKRELRKAQRELRKERELRKDPTYAETQETYNRAIERTSESEVKPV